MKQLFQWLRRGHSRPATLAGTDGLSGGGWLSANAAFGLDGGLSGRGALTVTATVVSVLTADLIGTARRRRVRGSGYDPC